MSGTEIVEEYNVLARAITELEGAFIALGLYWIICLAALWITGIDGLQFVDLLKDGTIVIALLKVALGKNSE